MHRSKLEAWRTLKNLQVLMIESDSVAMTAQWYALHSKPMKETLLWEQLGLHGMQSYYPCIRVRPVNPRARKIKPYFPGYVFVSLCLEQINLSMFRWMPGAAGIVAFGGTPAYVPDKLVVAIQRRVDQINRAGGERLDSLKKGCCNHSRRTFQRV